MIAPGLLGTWAGLFTNILPKPASHDFSSHVSAPTQPWLATNLPPADDTPSFARVQIAQGTPLWNWCHLSVNVPSKVVSSLTESFKDWKAHAFPNDTSVGSAFIGCLRAPVQQVVSSLTHPSGTGVSVIFEGSPQMWSQRGDGTLNAKEVNTAEDPSGETMSIESTALEFKLPRVLLRYANLLDKGRMFPQGRPFGGALGILVRHALQLAASGIRFGVISAGYCGFYTELVRLEDDPGLALLISPLRRFTAAKLPSELVSNWSDDEIERAKPSPFVAILMAMLSARIPGYEVAATGVSLEIPKTDNNEGDEEEDPLDQGSSDEADGDDTDEDYNPGGNKKRPATNSNKKPPRKKARDAQGGTSKKSSQLRHELNAELFDHHVMVSFSERSHSSTPVPYRRLDVSLQPKITASGSSKSPLLLSKPTKPLPFLDPGAGLRNVVISEQLLATNNSTVWKGIAERADSSDPLKIIFKFVSGEALRMVKHEILIYEAAYVKDVMPRYYCAWMREDGVTVGILLEYIKHPLENSGGKVTKLSLEARTKLRQTLRVLHKKGINHGDFYPRNVGLRADGTFCIFDFGCASLHKCLGKKS